QVLQPAQHRVSALATAHRHEEPVEIALEDPGRRIARVRTRKNRDDDGHIGALHESLDAVQEHRLPRDPPELLELFAPRARSTPGRDDHHPYIALDTAHGKSLSKSSAILRTP